MSAASLDPLLVAERISELREHIADRAQRRVTLVAVTKTFGVDAVTAAVGAGVCDIGENYAQEMVAKHAAIDALEGFTQPRWHFIGGLQRNKVKLIAPFVSLWHSVESVRLGTEIARRSPGAEVLLQVNMSGAHGQSGVAVRDIEDLATALVDVGLRVSGLMTIGHASDDVATRGSFGRLRSIADAMGLEHCSMGMSGDLDHALDAGATIVRIGSAIFGQRG